jgi:hypothetical protein
MNTWIWGPPTWDTLHNGAFLCDSNGIPGNDLVGPLNILLPCRYCRDSFQNFYEKLGRPVEGYTAQWVYKVHQLVNVKLRVQKLETFFDKHEIPKNVQKLMVEYQNELFTEPSFEVVQKRFLVNRDEPICWRNLSTMLLAICFGLVKLDTTNRGFALDGLLVPQYEALMTLLTTLRKIVIKSKQSNARAIVGFLGTMLKALEMRETPSQLITILERAKYKYVVDKDGPLKDASEATKLIQAGACISGTCM